uniref:Reverse transcriptase domain-containing protein n=1 Tax=Octopus bimaculoides TaxID=37653 RepID=A0A0L8GRL9_OCTBM
MSGFLFLRAIDWVMRRTTERHRNGIRWNFTSMFKDLNFAEDVALLSSTYEHILSKTYRPAENTDRIGLKLNSEKCKTLRNDVRQQARVRIGNNKVESIEEFVYFKLTVKKDRGETEEIKNRLSLQIAFYNLWRSNDMDSKMKKDIGPTSITLQM